MATEKSDLPSIDSPTTATHQQQAIHDVLHNDFSIKHTARAHQVWPWQSPSHPLTHPNLFQVFRLTLRQALRAIQSRANRALLEDSLDTLLCGGVFADAAFFLGRLELICLQLVCRRWRNAIDSVPSRLLPMYHFKGRRPIPLEK
jgi:hypothetical protein